MDQTMMLKIFHSDLTSRQKEQAKRFSFLGFPPGEAQRRRWYIGENMTVLAPETPSARTEARADIVRQEIADGALPMEGRFRL